VAEECDATVRTEVPVRVDGKVSYIDLVIEKGQHVTACEPENSSRRIKNDVRKAVALCAGRLLIPTPDAPTAHACRRALRRLPRSESELEVIICPLGAALEILRQLLNADNEGAIPGAVNSRKET
jgi:hypothetical protein